jgi:hypothetical protein
MIRFERLPSFRVHPGFDLFSGWLVARIFLLSFPQPALVFSAFSPSSLGHDALRTIVALRDWRGAASDVSRKGDDSPIQYVVGGNQELCYIVAEHFDRSSHMAKTPRKPPPPPKTSRKVKHEAGVGLAAPARLSNRQVQSLAGSVEAHIEPRRKTRPSPPKKPSGGGTVKNAKRR